MSQKSEKARDGICRVIQQCGGFDPEKNYVNIDRTWEDPRRNKEISAYVVEFIKTTYPVKDISSLFSVDTLAYPYGPIPIVTLAAQDLNKPLGIIKEGNDPISGQHGLFGARPDRNSLMIFDVTRFGITAMRLLMFLHEEAALPRWFLSIVDFEQGAFQFLKEKLFAKYELDCDFRSIVTLGELKQFAASQGEPNDDAFITIER